MRSGVLPLIHLHDDGRRHTDYFNYGLKEIGKFDKGQ